MKAWEALNLALFSSDCLLAKKEICIIPTSQGLDQHFGIFIISLQIIAIFLSKNVCPLLSFHRRNTQRHHGGKPLIGCKQRNKQQDRSHWFPVITPNGFSDDPGL